MVDAFGGEWPATRLVGGTGRSWRAGDIVLKPTDRWIAELQWQVAVLGRLRSDGFRTSPPIPAFDGQLIVDGWYATTYLVGQHEPGRWADIIVAGDAFHAAVAVEPRPTFLDERTDPWAIGDRVAWGELPASDSADARHISRLAAARRPVDAPAQVIHGDLTGNVLFADGVPPAIIDLSPYWRPAPFAAAIVVADALVWEGADETLLSHVRHIDRFEQYLVRALIYRMVTDSIFDGGSRLTRERNDPYRRAVEIALDRCGARATEIGRNETIRASPS